jgi:hypothetical protein
MKSRIINFLKKKLDFFLIWAKDVACHYLARFSDSLKCFSPGLYKILYRCTFFVKAVVEYKPNINFFVLLTIFFLVEGSVVALLFIYFGELQFFNFFATYYYFITSGSIFIQCCMVFYGLRWMHYSIMEAFSLTLLFLFNSIYLFYFVLH